ncbi:MAG: VanZ family protein [Chloroflexota bacterium]
MEPDKRQTSWGAKNLILAWGPVLALMAAIFYVSSQNTWTVFEGPPYVLLLRKGGHVFEYALLALLLGRALLSTWTWRGNPVTRPLLLRAWRVGVLICTLYAASDEFHQLFVPRRVGYGWDVLVDALSATAALGIWYIVRVHLLRRTAKT